MAVAETKRSPSTLGEWQPSDEIQQRVNFIPIANTAQSFDYVIAQKLFAEKHAIEGEFDERTAKRLEGRYIKMDFTDPDIGHPLYINLLHCDELDDLQHEFPLKMPPVEKIEDAVNAAYNRLMPPTYQ
jgi:hypothetical protein